MVAEAELRSESQAIPGGFRLVRGPGGLAWVERLGASPAPDAELWDRWIRGVDGKALDHPGGRAPVFLIETQGKGGMVLRSFRHGGLVGKLLSDRFLGVHRFLAELRVSEAIRQRGVPTPEVLALHFRSAGGLVYRGWILTRYLPGGENLRRWVEAGLPESTERRRVLRRAALTVASLHAVGCLHPDLNLSNLLLVKDEVFVLDLDGAFMESSPGIRARSSNLLRLYRSLAKVMGRAEPLSLRDRWTFVKAYAAGNGEQARALWRYLSARWVLARARFHLSNGLRRLLPPPSR